ncbi:hypothetical protein C4G66_RS04980 [Vibrio parahaemolyticus]|uniref:hypothetical protein n=2 Tax=Vibrionaceae TaxID=641 RepID=UPI0004A3766A|nr:hypothetical protein [Vibrio parahaemolyticus]MBT0096441.1 hypothetical protein [Vibrio alginolyticus]EGR0767558.1 hypothetical protein [Vibrio parahaemolyticus]EGR0837092.1 hypothetical protein [Vibrio parahaemolyticus]EGR1753033.1 hypothetical protein [Vibrio parahaemolyticus]EGR5850588.1 hypothetical protein [Vibrio parahaemolyticus]
MYGDEKKIFVILGLIAVAFYFYASGDENKISNLRSVEFSAKNRILTIAIDDDRDLQTRIRMDDKIEEAVFLNELIDKGTLIYADGNYRYQGRCQHVQLEWQKGELLLPKYYKVFLNETC